MTTHPVPSFGALSVIVATLLTACSGTQTPELHVWGRRFKLLERFYPMRARQNGTGFLIDLTTSIRSFFQITLVALLFSLSACGGGEDVELQPRAAKAFASATAPPAVVVFQRPKQDYTIQKTANGFAITDKVGSDGTKNVSATEQIMFADQSIALDGDDGHAAQGYRLYKAAFNRVPDLVGLGYWIDQMDKGASLLDIANAFVRTAEFTSIYGAVPTNAQIVDRYYKNALGRAGDDGGITYWNKLLNDKTATTADVLILFSNSAESKNLLSESLAMGVSYHAVGVSYQDLVRVTLFGINDLHGNLLPSGGSVTVADPANPAGTRVSAGGLAYMATLVSNLRAQSPNSIFVGAGDLIGASPLTSSLFHDEPTVEALNLMGLDVSAVGSYEFGKGPAELKRMQNGGCFPLSTDGSRGVVGVDTCLTAGKFAGAKFQYLAANVVEQSTGKTLLPPYMIRSVGGVDIAFIGLTHKDTPALVTPSGVVGLTFADEVKTVNDLIPELKAKGVSSIVVLLNQGGFTTATVANDKTCPGLNGDIVRLTDQMDPAVDVVISGHTHQEYVCTRPDGKLLTQAGNFGRLLTKIDLVIDRNAKKVKTKEVNNLAVANDVGIKNAQGAFIPLPAGMTALAKDSVMAALVQRFVDTTAPITGQVIGSMQTLLTRTQNSAGESQVGDVVADIYLAGSTGSVYGANAGQIAFAHPGGIRTDLNSSLQVTFGHLFAVMPFGNNLVTLSLTGEQILRLLEQQWEAPQPAGGRVMQVSNGFTYSWDASQPNGAATGTGRRVVPGSMKLNGVAISAVQSYRVTVNNFMATGGDNFTVLKSGTLPQAGVVDIDAGLAYFKALGTVPTPSQNRIIRLN